MTEKQKSLLLKVRGLKIEGYSDEKWIEIVHGVDLDAAPRRSHGT